MDWISEYAALTDNRRNLYGLLARLYRTEVDNEFWTQLANLGFPSECGEGELAEGYGMLAAFIRQAGLDPLIDLAVDFARVFLGAGISEGIIAYPYESVYTSRERLIMQEARDHVLAAYRARGLDKRGTLELPEDHISLELEFVAHLCRDTADAVAVNDWPAVSAHLGEQKKFLKNHLLNWVPAFCADIGKCAATDFYRALAKITNGYLRLDLRIIESMMAEASERTARLAP